MVLLDKVFFKNKKHKYKYLIRNNGDIETLNAYAEQIYNTEIKAKAKVNLLRKKYGGYKTEAIKTPLIKHKEELLSERI